MQNINTLCGQSTGYLTILRLTPPPSFPEINLFDFLQGSKAFLSCFSYNMSLQVRMWINFRLSHEKKLNYYTTENTNPVHYKG